MTEFFKNIVISYLTFLTSLKLKIFFKGKIIGVAGCYGKSSAVNLIEEVLLTKAKVRSTNFLGKGLNTESGIPFAILGIFPDKYRAIDWLKYSIQALVNFFKPMDYEYLILEMGVDRPKDMKFLTKNYRPDIAVLLNSNNTHSANFEEMHLETGRTYEDLISEENGYILAKAKEAIFYNLDDPEVVKQVARFKGNTKFPFSTEANKKINIFSTSVEGTIIYFNYLDEVVKISHPQPLLGEYRSTFEFIITFAEYLGIDSKKLGTVLENYKLPPSRCTLFDGVKHSYILDSSYNSSLVPTSSALSLLKEVSKNRKVAVLGDMRELGELSKQEHQKLAQIASKFADIVITVGPMMKEFFAPEFELAKSSSQQLFSFEKTKDALEFLTKDHFDFIQPDDVILVKGSQNTLLLELIVERLLANKNDISKLCRRDSLYEQKRRELLS